MAIHSLFGVQGDSLDNLPRWCKFLKEADNPGSQDLIRAIVESEDGIMKASDTLKNISDDGDESHFQ